MEKKSDKLFKLGRQDWQLALVLVAILLMALFAHLTNLKTLREFDETNSEVMGVYDGTGHLQNLDRHLIELIHTQENFIKTSDEIFAIQAEESITSIEKEMIGVRRFFKMIEQTAIWKNWKISSIEKLLSTGRSSALIAMEEMVLWISFQILLKVLS